MGEIKSTFHMVLLLYTVLNFPQDFFCDVHYKLWQCDAKESSVEVLSWEVYSLGRLASPLLTMCLSMMVVTWSDFLRETKYISELVPKSIDARPGVSWAEGGWRRRCWREGEGEGSDENDGGGGSGGGGYCTITRGFGLGLGLRGGYDQLLTPRPTLNARSVHHTTTHERLISISVSVSLGCVHVATEAVSSERVVHAHGDHLRGTHLLRPQHTPLEGGLLLWLLLRLLQLLPLPRLK